MGKGKKRSGKDSDIDGEGDEEKPLPKLVLKVGKEKKIRNEEASNETEYSHHKKKKKKHKHKLEEARKQKLITETKHETLEKKSRKRDAPEADAEPPIKRVKVHREKEKPHLPKEPEIPQLRLCLENLHRTLQRKDVYNIFTYPVTDLIAPGYTKIIKSPMDFLTMQKNIETGQYTSIEQFKTDYVVMCNNAMLYNGSDTIYYKSAEKMLSIGLKMLAKEKMKKMSKAIGIHVSDSEDDIILVDESSDINIEQSAEEMVVSPKKNISEKKYKSHKRESVRQSSSITASVLAAAQMARQKLLKKHPNQHYGYLSKDDQGNTSLNIFNPDTTKENKSLPVNLGKLAGKLQSGLTPGQALYKEDKKNRIIPVNYLLYGPYGTFGPTYDSSLSNITKEESVLLLKAYGTEVGTAYAKSLLNFTDQSSHGRNYVDRILDSITEGGHSSFLKMQQEANQQKVLQANGPGHMKLNEKSKGDVKSLSKIDIASLFSLDDVGIDTSFLKNMIPHEEKENNSNNPETKLKQNAELLQNLKETQEKRLSSRTGGTTPVNDKEIKIATSITGNLKDLLTMVSPKYVVSSEGIKRAIGFGEPPVDPSNNTEKDGNLAELSTGENNKFVGISDISATETS